MNEQNFRDILDGYLKGIASADEKRAAEAFFDAYRKEGGSWPYNIMGDPEDAEHEILQRILEKQAASRRRDTNNLWLQKAWKVAATLLILISAGYATYMVEFRQHSETTAETPVALHAGGNRAILTLSDGTTVELDSAGVQNLPVQGNVHAVNKDGMLAYQAQHDAKQVLYNTVVTPRGGQYQVALADGTKVWLNSVSSLRYPVTFAGRERVVELTGEAYFEVAKNAQMPFTVRIPPDVAGAPPVEVRVLGTHFNVMAYDDESIIATTLLEGRVEVARGTTSGVLAPGQQAQLSPDGSLGIVSDYDVAQAVAWKNGSFAFNDTPLDNIMRQISRWYDVEVVFSDDVRSLQFGGVVSRRENALAVLDLLELTGEVSFDVHGRKIIVKKGKSMNQR